MITQVSEEYSPLPLEPYSSNHTFLRFCPTRYAVTMRVYLTGTDLAKSSLSRRTSSSAVHWSDREVKPQMSANRMLEQENTLVMT